jgi:hypothetical protein
VRRLTEAEYKATMSLDPRQVGPDELPPFDFWGYVEDVPRDDWEGHDFSAGTVSYAYEMEGGRWYHVLVESADRNVHLVLVLDLERRVVLGHHLLDLNRLYGVDDT